MCEVCAGDSRGLGRIRIMVRIRIGIRIRIRKVMIGDPTSKCLNSRTNNNYMRWEMIPLLEAAGKK